MLSRHDTMNASRQVEKHSMLIGLDLHFFCHLHRP